MVLKITRAAKIKSLQIEPKQWALILLVAATALYRFQFDIAGISLRAEHIALFIVLPLLLIYSGRGGWLKRQDGLLVLYLLLALLASTLNAPVRTESFKFLGIMALGVIMYLVVRKLASTPMAFIFGVKAMTVAGVAMALYGVAAWLIFPAGPDLGITLYRLSNAPAEQVVACTFSPYGTLLEPNILGGYVMAVSLMLGVWFSATRLRTGWPLVMLLGGTTLALAFSLTRGAWLGLVVGLGLICLFAPKKRYGLGVSLGALAILVPAAIFAASYTLPCNLRLPTNANEAVAVVRANAEIKPTQVGVVNSDTPTVATPTSEATDRILTNDSVNFRLGTFQQAFEDWRKNPLIGNGANSFAQKYITSSNTRAWISNLELMALHDTGIIGLLVLLGWLGWLGWEVLQALRKATSSNARTCLLALSIGFAGLLVAYQTTTAFWLGFTWIYLGLISAGVQILRRQTEIQQQVLREITEAENKEGLVYEYRD